MAMTVLGTRTGVYRLDDHTLRPIGLQDRNVSAVHAFMNSHGKPVILAGTYGDGLFRSEDDGRTWNSVGDGLTVPAFRTIAPDPTVPGAILCGTEPSRIFRSLDGGHSWKGLEGIPELPDSDEWFLPYSPRAGAVRNIYAPPGSSRLLASVEVGGLLDSADRGATWRIGLVAGDSDIHFVTGHPDDPDLLYAALGWASLKSVGRTDKSPPLGGIARSRDGGGTWEKLHTHYTRAVIVPPSRPGLLLAGPADRVGEQGRIEVSADGGDSWQPAGQGIAFPMEDMVEEFLANPNGSIWAICSGGRLMLADPDKWMWTSALPEESDIKVRSVAFFPET